MPHNPITYSLWRVAAALAFAVAVLTVAVWILFL